MVYRFALFLLPLLSSAVVGQPPKETCEDEADCIAIDPIYTCDPEGECSVCNKIGGPCDFPTRQAWICTGTYGCGPCSNDLQCEMAYPEELPFCVRDACQECNDNSGCPPDRPFCGNGCVECLSDDHCAGDLVCSLVSCVPPRPPNPFECFSGETLVDVAAKGLIPMKDLQVGDKVLTKQNHFEEVYAFGHREPSQVAVFLQLYTKETTTNAPPLEITADHLLFRADGKAVPASTIAVGDELRMVDGSVASVSQILQVVREGIYAPLVKSGRLGVGKVEVSSYVTVQTNSSKVKIAGVPTLLEWHWASHAFQAPHRIYCTLADCSSGDGTPFQVDLLMSLRAVDQAMVQMGVVFPASVLSLWGVVASACINVVLLPVACLFGMFLAAEVVFDLLTAVSPNVFVGCVVVVLSYKFKLSVGGDTKNVGE